MTCFHRLTFLLLAAVLPAAAVETEIRLHVSTEALATSASMAAAAASAAADAGIRTGGQSELKIWAQEAASRSDMVTSRAWQRRAQSIMSMLSGIEGKVAPPETIAQMRIIIGILNEALEGSTAACTGAVTATTNGLSATRGKHDLVVSQSEVVKTDQGKYDACFAAGAGLDQCWKDWLEDGCTPTDNTTTTTTTTTVEDPDPSSCEKMSDFKTTSFSIPEASRASFECNFATGDTADSCFQKMIHAGADSGKTAMVGSIPQYLIEEGEKYEGEKRECASQVPSSSQEQQAQVDRVAIAKLEKDEACTDSEFKCKGLEWTCKNEELQMIASMCGSGGLQEATQAKCAALKGDFFNEDKIQDSKDAGTARQTTWEGLWLIKCMLTKFIDAKTFESQFHETCIADRPAYATAVCDPGDSDTLWADLKQLMTVPNMCPGFEVDTKLHATVDLGTGIMVTSGSHSFTSQTIAIKTDADGELDLPDEAAFCSAKFDENDLAQHQLSKPVTEA